MDNKKEFEFEDKKYKIENHKAVEVNKIIPLDKKIELMNIEPGDRYHPMIDTKDIKNSLQNIQNRFKVFLEGEWIANRILAEYRKHKTLNWAKIAQGKIRSNINLEFDQIFKEECGGELVK